MEKTDQSFKMINIACDRLGQMNIIYSVFKFDLQLIDSAIIFDSTTFQMSHDDLNVLHLDFYMQVHITCQNVHQMYVQYISMWTIMSQPRFSFC